MDGVKVNQVKTSEPDALFSLIFTMVLEDAIAPSLSGRRRRTWSPGLFLFRGVSVAEQPAAAPNTNFPLASAHPDPGPSAAHHLRMKSPQQSISHHRTEGRLARPGL